MVKIGNLFGKPIRQIAAPGGSGSGGDRIGRELTVAFRPGGALAEVWNPTPAKSTAVAQLGAGNTEPPRFQIEVVNAYPTGLHFFLRGVMFHDAYNDAAPAFTIGLEVIRARNGSDWLVHPEKAGMGLGARLHAQNLEYGLIHQEWKDIDDTDCFPHDKVEVHIQGQAQIGGQYRQIVSEPINVEKLYQIVAMAIDFFLKGSLLSRAEIRLVSSFLSSFYNETGPQMHPTVHTYGKGWTFEPGPDIFKNLHRAANSSGWIWERVDAATPKELQEDLESGEIERVLAGALGLARRSRGTPQEPDVRQLVARRLQLKSPS